MRRFVCHSLCLLLALGMAWGAHGAPYDSPLYAFAQGASVAHDVADPTLGNRIGIIDDAHEALLLRVHLIRHAQRSIRLQTFILANDECGRLIMSELLEAAKRGVVVEMIVDHIMSAQDADFMARLAGAHPNLHMKIYRPIARVMEPNAVHILTTSLLLSRSTNQRMHNKLMVCDDVIGLTGGRNLDNHYYNCSTDCNFIDRDALVVGPVLAPMIRSFEKYWAFRHSVPAAELRDVARLLGRESFEAYKGREDFDFGGLFVDLDAEVGDDALIQSRFVDTLVGAERVTFLADKPGKNRAVGPLGFWGSGRVTKRIRKAFRATRSDLVIQSPYLVVGTRMRRALRKARKREKPRIVISTNSFAATDNTLAYSGNYKMRASYIEALGFHIYELKPHPEDLPVFLPNYDMLEKRAEEKRGQGDDVRGPFLCVHAKSFVIDEKIAYIGSFNIDPRSDNLNSEVGLFIEDSAIARDLKARIMTATKPGNSWVIGKRKDPLDDLNYFMVGLSGLSPVDLWPMRYTTSFELRPGEEPVPPDDKDFYARYKDVGSFPETDWLSTRAIAIQLYKMLGLVALPVL